MSTVKEKHVYEIELPEHFDHIEVKRVGEKLIRIEIKA